MKKEKVISRRQLIKGAVASGALLSTGLSNRAFAAPASKDILIGVCTPLSGPLAYNGKATVQGARLALEEKNAKGGAGGRKFTLVIGDDAANPKEAIPFLLREYKDSAYDGLFVSQKGWGTVLVDPSRLEEAEGVLRDLFDPGPDGPERVGHDWPR